MEWIWVSWWLSPWPAQQGWTGFFCVEQPASLVCCKGEPSVPGQQNTPQCDLACGTGFWCPTANESTSLLTEMWEKCRKKGQKTVVCMQKMLFNRLPSVEAESQSDKNQHFLSTVCSLTLSVFCHTLFLSLISIKSNSGMTSEKLFYSISSWKNVLSVN